MPSGIATGLGTIVAFLTTTFLHHHDILPLWACILIGVGIFGVGLYCEIRYGYIE